MYLGLDLGTSGLRGVLIDENQSLIGSANFKYKVQNPHKGWSEQNPNDWLIACKKVISALASKFPLEVSNLLSIGITGQMHGATLLDKNGAVIRPCILWNDTRAYIEATEMDSNELFRKVSGNIVFPGFTAPKVAWVKQNEPENFKKIWKILLPKDYLRFWLSGEFISEMSDAAGTGWFDLTRRQWSDILLEKCDLSVRQMPLLVEGSQVAGTLRNELKKKWSIKGDVFIAGGAGDNAAAACGCGVISEGQGLISLGTSGVVLVARDGCYPSPKLAVHTFCHALPNKWYQMGVILAATDSLNWLSKITGEKASELSNQLSDQLVGPSDIKFIPYLSGERTPHNDPLIRGAFIGLDIAHNRIELTKAVFEGIAFALRDNLEALIQTGVRIEKLFILGGGARSKFWLKTISTVLNIPLVVPRQGELGAAFGAARLAMIAKQDIKIKEVMKEPRVKEVIYPKQDLIAAYDDAYQIYTKIYPKHKELK